MNREKRNNGEKTFIDMDAVLKLLEQAKRQQASPAGSRVLDSRNFEDQTYQKQRRDTPAWDEAEATLQSQIPFAESLSRDMFQSLYTEELRYKPDEEILPQARAVNKSILEMAVQSEQYEDLRGVTSGNELLSAEAAQQFILSLEQGLRQSSAGNPHSETSKVIARLQEKARAKAEQLGRLLGNSQTPSAKVTQAGVRLDSLLSQMKHLEQKSADDFVRFGVRNAAISALYDALVSVGELKDILNSWGNGKASVHSAVINRELIQTVHDNNRLKEISRYLGRLKEMLRLRRKNGFTYGRGEPFTIVRGNSLEEVLPAELARMASPLTLPYFLRDYLDGKLMQYQRRDRICKGSGDIVTCLDESASTKSCVNDTWGMTVALALLDAASHENRKYALIHFSDSMDIRTDIYLPGQYKLERVLNSAMHFFNGGGTDFERPLREAVGVLRTNDFRNADVVFITDGICSISEEFKAWLKNEKAELHFTITGVLMDQEGTGRQFSLEPFCEHIYRLSELGAERIADILVNSHAQ